MPFQSKAQQGFLFKFHPEVARRFADETPKGAYKKLPYHKKTKAKKKLIKTAETETEFQMDRAQTYKAAFLAKCADAGLTEAETLEVVKEAADKLAAFNTLWEKPYNTLWDAAGGIANAGKNLGIVGMVAAPLALGAGAGYGAAQLTNLNDEDVDETKLKELIDEHRRLAQRARLTAAMSASKRQTVRRGRPLI